MNGHELSTQLDSLRKRAMSVSLSSGAMRGTTLAIAVVLCCAWIDLALDLPGAVRLLAILAAIFAVIALSVQALSQARAIGSPRALAARLDRVGNTQGQILSGTSLLIERSAVGGSASVPITLGLKYLAIERATELASRISPFAALPAASKRTPMIALLAMGAIVFVVGVAAPRMVWTQVLRFADPFGDHPPYSRIRLTVEPANAKVLYGQNLDVHVAIDGGSVEEMSLILKNANGADETIPMFPDSDGGWRGTIAGVTSPAKYLVRSSEVRSKQFPLSVITVPKIESARFRIVPPAYTNRAAYDGPLPQGGIAGLSGTMVEVTVKSNRPLKSGAMTLVGMDQARSENIAMNPTSDRGNEATGSFSIRAAAAMNLRVTDVDGQDSVDPFTAPITMLADERPFVRVLEPKPMSLATPDVAVPISLLAEDDCGISRLQLYRALNDSAYTADELPVPSPAPTRLPGASVLQLVDYGLKPGDVVKLFARVEDNDPAGAKGSESPVVTIRIISNEQMQQIQLERDGIEVLMSKYAQASRRIEAIQAQIDQLTKDLEKLEPNTPAAKETRDKISDLAEKMKKEADAIDQAAAEQLPFDIDKKMSNRLKELAAKLSEASKDAAALSKQAGLSAAQLADKLKEMQKKLGDEKKDFEDNTTVPLDFLERVVALKQDEARFVELYQLQRDLEQRMAALKLDGMKSDDPKLKARMRDLQAEQREIRESLGDLLADIDFHAAAVPDDPDHPELAKLRDQAKEFAAAVRDSGASDQMSAAEAALSEFDRDPAAEQSKAAADTLEQFIHKCNSMGDSACKSLNFNPTLSESLGDTVAQMLAAMGFNSTGNGRGGYSARRNTTNNVGLYGHLPTRSMAGAGFGTMRAGAGTAGRNLDDAGDKNDASDNGGNLGAGDSSIVVPPAYRTRVGEYFRRVADELGDTKSKK